MSVASVSKELGVSNMFTNKKRKELFTEAFELRKQKEGDLSIIIFEFDFLILQDQLNSLLRKDKSEGYDSRYFNFLPFGSEYYNNEEKIKFKFGKVRRNLGHLNDFIKQIQKENNE